jgi:hypothetical protein
MTVISCVITRYCTVHSSDSLITQLENENYKVLESRRTKIVAVRKWRGAMAYWGLAEYDQYKWSTFNWLQKMASNSSRFASAEEFAKGLKDKLNEEISKMRFIKPKHSGIGIHLTAYEHVKDYSIPELFLISNWTDTSYQSVNADGFRLSRETYGTIFNIARIPQHQEVRYRLEVHKFLQESKWFIFNNGDPTMFNPAANSILRMFELLAEQGKIAKAGEVGTYHAIARLPIEIVSRIQRDFCRKEARLVGGKLHDLAITPDGEYSSSTGD